MAEKKETIKDRLLAVRNTLSKALLSAGRKDSACTLVAVSKTKSVTQISEAIAAGHKVFAENRVQEALEKWSDLKQEQSDITLHLIGPLQTNKARQAVLLFDVIETVDREKLARTLFRVMGEENKFPKIYVQVNIGAEEQKTGVLPENLSEFLKTVEDDIGLQVEGLMCIPPQDEEPSLYFALLKNLADKHGLKGVSMGMSSDYDIAAKLGATSVRVGTDIFGAREIT